MIANGLKFALTMIGVFWMFIVGGGAVYWWDRRPADVPSFNVPVLWWHWTLRTPQSLKARLDAITLADARATALARSISARNAILATTIANQDQTAVTHIRTVTQETIRYVPQFVTPSDDRACVIPVGFVRVFNASASGVNLPVPTDATRITDAAPSGVDLSTVARVTAINDGIALENAQRLQDLQAWVRGVTAK